MTEKTHHQNHNAGTADGGPARLRRREFLRLAGRWALGGGLLALATILGRQTRFRPLPGQTCVGDGVCRGCAQLPGCALPQAVSVKRAGRTGSG